MNVKGPSNSKLTFEPYESPRAVRLSDAATAVGACSPGSRPTGSCKFGNSALAACGVGNDAQGSCVLGGLPHHCSNGMGVTALGY